MQYSHFYSLHHMPEIIVRKRSQNVAIMLFKASATDKTTHTTNHYSMSGWPTISYHLMVNCYSYSLSC